MNVKPFIKLLRVHQWVKNLLIFVPIIMAHRWDDFLLSSAALVAFFSFSLIASSVYITNDIVDIEADKAHPTKKTRPIASGAISRTMGLIAVPFLLSIGFSLALAISPRFLSVILFYFLVTTVYSFLLKRIPIVDILTLAALYSLRILAGAVACDVPISQWLLAFSMFLFFSLACVKRYDELATLAGKHDLSFRRRGYRVEDLSIISQFGITSGFLSILVLALYLNSGEVTLLYEHAEYLWFVCPLFFYWICRVWLKTTRGDMHEDPVVFALKDRASYLVGLMLIGIICLSL